MFIRILSEVRNYVYDIIVPSFQKYLKTTLYNNIIDRYSIDYKELNIGSILYNFQHMPATFSRFVLEVLEEYIPNILAVSICIGFLFYLNWKIGIISIIGIIILVTIVFTTVDTNIELSKVAHEKSKNDNELVQDRIHNLFNIYTSGTEDLEKSDYDFLTSDVEKAVFDNYIFITKIGCSIDAITSGVILISFLVIYFTYKEPKHKGLDSKDIITIILMLNYYTRYISRIGGSYVGISEVLGYINESDSFISEITPDTTNPTIAPVGYNMKGSVKFKNVNFNYPDGKELFNNFNLDIPENSKVAIYGKSGSGKTTLIKLLMGFYGVGSGSITINGIDVSTVNIQELRKNISVVNQNVKLFNKSVMENILYGTGKTEEDALSLIKDLGITIFDDNLNFDAGLGGSNLSGGQKACVTILKCMLKDSHIILLDEPTSALDDTTKKLVLSMIKKLSGKTVIIITHDTEVIGCVNKFYTLESLTNKT